MQPGAILCEGRPMMLLGTSRKPEAGASSNAIERVGVVVDDSRQSHERQHAPVEGGARLEVPHRNINMSDSVDLHREYPLRSGSASVSKRAAAKTAARYPRLLRPVNARASLGGR